MSGTEQPAVETVRIESSPGRSVLGRRRLLSLAGAGLATAGLAACTPMQPVAARKPAAPKGSRSAPAKPVSATSVPATSPTPKSATGTTPTSSSTAPKAVATNPDGVAADPTIRRPHATLPILRADGTLTPGDAVPNLLGTDPLWHLLRRATFGPTPEAVAEIRAKGIPTWLDEQLNPASVDDSACDAYLTRYPSLPMTTMQIRAAYPRYSWEPMADLGRASLARAIWSKRQVFEVMVEFWSNHFNVTTPSGEVWDLKTVEDREVQRRHALGKFADLLQASAKSCAMSYYLDNYASSVDGLNENYGRELLELHTVGVDAGYTQTDVVNSARLMTGYTVGVHGEFAYRNDWRYLGPVQVLGFSSPNSNDFDGLHVAEAYLNYLAHHPATARHLASKLAIRFVADNPPSGLVDRLAQIYLDNDTAIAPVLRALFLSPEFAASIGQKTKRPIEDVVGALRAVGIAPATGTNTSLSGFYYTLNGLGQAPLYWGPPNGYPDQAAAWLSTVGTLGRWNAHIAVIAGWATDGMSTPAAATLLGGATIADNGALVDAIALRLLGIRLVDPQRSAIVNFLDSQSSRVADNIKWRINETVALVFNSPNWIQR